jgi:MFS transporter, SHS family, lactate transporter
MRRTQLIWPNGFPTEVRATAGAFCFHQGAIFGGLMVPTLTFFAVNMHLGFAIPMLIRTIAGCASFIVALLLSPETRGKQLMADVVLA